MQKMGKKMSDVGKMCRSKSLLADRGSQYGGYHNMERSRRGAGNTITAKTGATGEETEELEESLEM